MKKTLLIPLALSGILYAGEIDKVCSPGITVEFSPVGDTRGESVLSKKETVRDCNITTTIKGECIRWKEERNRDSLPMEAYSGFEANDFTDSVGQFFATAGAYDQMEHIWSGYWGHCVIGTLQNFDWAADPMFWGSMAMDYLMAGGEAGAVGESFNEGVTSLGSEAMTNAAANDAVLQAMKESTETLATEAVKGAIKEAAENLGKCLVAGAVDMAAATADFMSAGTGDGDDRCNPIDEICEEDNEDTAQSNIMTMDIVVFDDLVATYEADGEDIYQYIEVIDNGSTTGVVSYRFKKTYEMEEAIGLDNSEMEEMREKVKLFQAGISVATTSAKLATCTLGYSAASTSVPSKQSDDQAINAETILSQAISMGTKFIPPPAGPLIGAALKVALALATSFESVDSCYKETDAQEQGSRHEATQKALKFNLCRPLYDTCEDEFVWGGCALDAYEFCCYDQLLTKVLVSQMKAQLGRDWTNCTGISLNDLNFISFRECTTDEKKDGVDGAHKYGLDWDITESFQHKNKCMDMTEFKDYLRDVLGEDIDPAVMDDYWGGLMNKQPI